MVNRSRLLKRRLVTYGYSFFRTLLLVGIGFLILFPIFTKFISSFKSTADYMDSTVLFLPKDPVLTNFTAVMQSVDYGATLLYTVFFCGLLSLLQVASCTVVAYGLARFRFPGRNIIFGLAISTMVIPPQAILLPLFLKFRYFNPLELFKFGGSLTGVSLVDTWIPFILMALLASGFKNGLYIFLLRQHFMNVPSVLEEAAYIDGCGTFKTFFRIMLPSATPIMVSVFLFSFVWQWNDYYYTIILAPELGTLNMRLLGMSVGEISEILGDLSISTLQSPKFILLIAPLIILYLVFQKQFTESIVKSGIVG